MFTNLRLALRLLAKSRGFSSVAILTLAVTIGVNSAIFSLIDGALLRPAVPLKPEQVVCIFTGSRDAKRSFRQFSYAEFEALRESNGVFNDVAAVNFNYVSLGAAAELRRSLAFMVSDNYFELMGAKPEIGRFFTTTETRPNARERVVVASHALWQRNGGRADYVGSAIVVNGQPHDVIGVSPENFSGVSALVAPEIWLPFGLFSETTTAFGETSKTNDLADPKTYSANLMGRMRPGLTIKSATAQLPQLAARLGSLQASEGARDLTLTKPFGINTSPADAGPLRLIGVLLFCMSGVVLIIGCLNLANMMLARGSARSSEMAVRLALGATRSQIVRQLMMEGLVLAVIGGALGLLLSLWTNTFLQNFFAAEFNSFNLTLTARLQPDFAVVGATFLLCLVATLLFSLGPALRSSRADLVRDLKGLGGDDAASGAWSRFFSGRHLMVMAQIALSLVMLFSAGLFVRTAVKEGDLTSATGFTKEGFVVAEIDFALARVTPPEVMRRVLAAAERIRRLPGVSSAGLTSLLPYNSSIETTRLVRAEAPVTATAQTNAPAAGAAAIYSSISSGYFDSIGLRVLRGRDFTALEVSALEGKRVCVIDQGMAEKLFPGEDALGRRVRPTEPSVTEGAGTMEIVGIVNRHSHGLEDRQKPAANVYVPLAQAFRPTLFMAVRNAKTDRAALLQAISTFRRELREADSDLPILTMQPFTSFMQKNFTIRMVQLGAMIFGVFGAIALLLASVGVYGVKAYAVERRTREIGIRIALGATRRDIMFLIMKQGAQQTLAAVAIGILLSFVAGHALTAMFFQIKSSDALAMVTAASLLTCATLLACFLPAKRAMRVSPLSALRTE